MAQTTFTGPVRSLNGFTSGSSASPIANTSADNLSSFYGTTSATTGDVRLNYSKLTFTSTGSGETASFYSVVTGANGATGGTINGAHISLSINGSGTISGAGNALRVTLGGTSTAPGGTIAALQVDSDFLTANQAGWNNASFLRFTNSSTGSMKYLARVPTVASAGILAAHITDAMTHSIRCVDAAGTVFYLMATTTATNRTGGA